MKVDLPKYKCSKCGHEWIPKNEEIFICPECKAPLEKYPPEQIGGK